MADQSTRLRAVLFLSVADIFMGAAGLILALIVLASEQDETRTSRFAEVIVSCQGGDPDWLIKADGQDPLSLDSFISEISQEGFLIRVGLFVEPHEMRCYAELQKMIRRHNTSLTERGTAAANLSLVWLPETSQSEIGGSDGGE